MLNCFETARIRAVRSLAVLSSAALLSTTVGTATADTYLSLGGLYMFSAEDEETFEVNGTATTGTLELDTGFGGFVAVGHAEELDPEVEGRIELELGYFQADTDSVEFTGGVNVSDSVEGEVSSLNLMVNGYLSLTANDFVRPYFGVGIGVASATLETPAQTYAGVSVSEFSETSTEFAYQIMPGIGFAMSEDVELRFGYRGLGIASTFFSHSIEVGLLF